MIRVSEKDKEVIVTPTGDVVAEHVEELKNEIVELVHYEYKHIIVDFKNVEMIDSMGIGMLVSTKNSLKRIDGELTVMNLTNDIMEMFKLMNLEKHFAMSGRE